MSESILISLLIGFLIVGVILVIFQFVYIRSALAKYEQTDIKVIQDIKDAAAEKLQTRTNTRMYSIKIDSFYTNKLNNEKYFIDGIRSRLPEHNLALPYNCTGRILPINSLILDSYVIAMERTTSSDVLISDVLMRRINYLVIKHKTYLVKPINDFLETILLPLFVDENAKYKEKAASLQYLIIYDITTNQPIERMESDDCTFEMSSMFEKINTTPATQPYSSISTFNDRVLTSNIVHVFGYNTVI